MRSIPHTLSLALGFACVYLSDVGRIDNQSVPAASHCTLSWFMIKSCGQSFSGPRGTAVALSHEYLTTHQKHVNAKNAKEAPRNYFSCPFVLQDFHEPSRTLLPSALVNYLLWHVCVCFVRFPPLSCGLVIR